MGWLEAGTEGSTSRFEASDPFDPTVDMQLDLGPFNDPSFTRRSTERKKETEQHRTRLSGKEERRGGKERKKRKSVSKEKRRTSVDAELGKTVAFHLQVLQVPGVSPDTYLVHVQPDKHLQAHDPTSGSHDVLFARSWWGYPHRVREHRAVRVERGEHLCLWIGYWIVRSTRYW